MAKRNQPHWEHPNPSSKYQLKLYNSLTREKELFVPQFGNTVLWYSCGPTVYDASHMGHARSYISFDILRRVLSEYFCYDVFYVMNITDIDDKIIKRARQKFLFEEYVKNNTDLLNVISDIKKALKYHKTLVESVEDKDKKAMLENLLIITENAVAHAERKSMNSSEEVLSELLLNSEDILSEWEDSKKSESEFDNSIFFKLPAKWEEAFYQDMDALNIHRPDAVTRVTEYIPEIVSYVGKIIENNLAYESNGSVYFDTVKFNDMPNHFYGKLVPEAFGDLQKLEEGEGELSISADRLSEKKNSSDFALWKKSKPGEPAWVSPWGKGRPGWHIECSVMASALLGESIDIHTGGFDLKFPHHDNELAQAEAYFNNDHWVRYFLHSGHLTISGCKMSKSLKNFISIQAALQQHTPRQIRLAFLLHSWKDTLDYSPQTMAVALHYEKFINEFFLNAKDSVRDVPKNGRESFQKWTGEDKDLSDIFLQKQNQVHESLCDSIDTQSAMEKIHDLISVSNVYIRTKKTAHLVCNRVLLMNIMSYIIKVLKVFGANFGDLSHDVSAVNSLSPEANEDIVMPYLKAMADFRENIRQKAIEIKATSILKLCDELRNDILPSLGVRLEDQEGSKSAIKLVDPADLLREKEMKLKMEYEKNLKKEKVKQEQEALKAAREAQKRMPPNEMFKSMTDKYSQFNDKGIPTHDYEGKQITDSQLKKIMKLYTAQEKKYNEYLKSLPAA